MQKIILILILMTLFPTAAEEINPKEITSSKIFMEISGKIHITEGVNEITYSQTFPLEDANQKILSFNSIPESSIITDEKGNREIAFTWVLPRNSHEYENVLYYKINMEVEKKSFPVIFEKLNDTKEYLKNDNNITRWNNEIKTRAAEITNSDNDLINAAEMSFWIHENVVYDLNYSDTEKDASWVFENRKGVCDELSRLLISMARSQDIPARDVAGLVYNGEEWNAHAWAEIYYDSRWISFDPTYNEMGFVDGAHIVFSRDANNALIRENIQWTGSVAGDLKGKWEDAEKMGEKVKGKTNEGVYNEKNEKIKFLKINKTKILDANLVFNDSEVGENTLINATLELKNLINSPVIGTYDVFSVDEIRHLPGDEIFYIEPYSRENLTLNFAVLKMENKNLKYFLPVIVKTFPYAAAESELSVDPGIITGVKIIIGSEFKVEADIKNLNQAEREYNVSACIKSNTKDYSNCTAKILNVSGNSNETPEFLFKIPDGNYTLYIKASSGESFNEFTRNVSIDRKIKIPEEFVEIPYTGRLRAEEFFIIIFLLMTIIGICLLKKI